MVWPPLDSPIPWQGCLFLILHTRATPREKSKMPQWRKLHTKIVQSLDYNEMSSDFVRLTWAMLPLCCCREGRGMYNGSWLRSNLYPLREDIKAQMMIDAMNEFAELEMVILYRHGRRREYFQIIQWHEHQGATSKEAPSPYPRLEDGQILTNSRVSPELVQSKSGVSKTISANNHSIYISESISESSSESLKGGLGENGRYEGHIENMRSQESQDVITAICNVVKGENAEMPSDDLERTAAKILAQGNVNRIPGLRKWWDTYGQYSGRPALKSFNMEWDNYIEGVDMTPKDNGKEKLTPLQKIVRDLEAKNNVMD